jgi:hypothetical protein
MTFFPPALRAPMSAGLRPINNMFREEKGARQSGAASALGRKSRQRETHDASRMVLQEKIET